MKKLMALLIGISVLSGWIFAEEEGHSLSLEEERREILHFGTDEAVLNLVEALKNEGDNRYNPELLNLISQTLNPKLAMGILSFFRTTESDEALEYCRNYLKNHDEYDRRDEIAQLIECIRYIKSQEDADSLPWLHELIEHRDDQVQSEAIRALGLIGNQESGKKLLVLLDDREISANRKADAILSLGELAYTEALEPLMEIAEEEGRDSSQRWYACHALGQLGDEKALPVLKNIFAADDPFLRSYAASGVSFFSTQEAQSILMAALRDSHPRVRSAAAEGLGRQKSDNALDALWYLLRKDSDKSVRESALTALAELGAPGWNKLKELAVNDKQPLPLRLNAISQLHEKKPAAAASVLDEIFTEEWEENESWIIDQAGRIISREADPAYQSLYRRLLTHPWYILRIYGIRGAMKTNMTTLKDDIENLSEDEKQPALLRREAEEALKEL